jgi:hypothetical protein
MTWEASQPLCANEDDPLTQEAGAGEVIISMTEYADSGAFVSMEDTETTEI